MRGFEKYFAHPPYKSKKVLLVDDEKDLGWIMKEIFKEAGHSLVFATSAKEGMEKFKKIRNLDTAIIDLTLGRESGLTFAKKARAINGKVQLVMISAFGSQDVEKKARRIGIHHFLHKPLKAESVLNIINGENG